MFEERRRLIRKVLNFSWGCVGEKGTLVGAEVSFKTEKYLVDVSLVMKGVSAGFLVFTKFYRSESMPG